MRIIPGDALELIEAFDESPALIATDPPYAFGGNGDEHALSAVVAIVLRRSAELLITGGWMVVLTAASWRSIAYVTESVRGVKHVTPVRVGMWTKPTAKTKARTPGWAWASVAAVVFRKGDGRLVTAPSEYLDHVSHAPLIEGRRAQLPEAVADWAVRPFSVPGLIMLDPFAGSGALCAAAERAGMTAIGFELATARRALSAPPEVC